MLETMVSWFSKKQVIVARFGTEVGYQAITTNGEELEVVKSLHTKLGFEL